MKETPIEQIIHLCRKIDEIACDVYVKLADLCDDPELSKFWRDMSKEEAKHVSFWRRTDYPKNCFARIYAFLPLYRIRYYFR